MRLKAKSAFAHFIFNLASLYPTFREVRRRVSRVIAHSKKNHNALAQWREKRSRDEIPRNRYDTYLLLLARFSSSFVFKAQRMRERDKDGSRCVGSCHPICQSKCLFKNLRSRKKEERILRADDEIDALTFFTLSLLLFRSLSHSLLLFLLLLRLKTGRRELDGGRRE